MNKEWKRIIIVTFLAGVIMAIVFLIAAFYLIPFIKLTEIPVAPKSSASEGLKFGYQLSAAATASLNGVEIVSYIIPRLFFPLLLIYWVSVSYVFKPIKYNHKKAVIIFSFITLYLAQAIFFFLSFGYMGYTLILTRNFMMSGFSSVLAFLFYYKIYSNRRLTIVFFVSLAALAIWASVGFPR